jgi:hypothetical protein
MSRALVLLTALWLAILPAEAQTPNQNILRMNGGYHPAYYCDYTRGSFCGGESYSRSGTIECVNASGVYAALGANAACFEYSFGSSPTPLGLRIWQPTQNYTLYSRDLTQASAWTLGLTMTAVHTATGIDGVVNSATLLTAGLTSATDTVVQATTLASASDTYEVWIKGVTLTGAINLSLDNGTANYVAATISNCSLNGVATAPNTSGWVKCVLGPTTLTNPSIRIQVVNSGDAIDIDSAQLENVGVAGPPIFTAASAVATAADVVALRGTPLQVLQGSVGTVVAEIGSLGVGSIGVSGARVVGGSASGATPLQTISTNGIGAYNGSVNVYPFAALNYSAKNRGGTSWSSTAINVWNNGVNNAISNDTHGIGLGDYGSAFIGSSNGSSNFLNGYVTKDAFWNNVLPNSILKTDTILTTRLH